MRNIGYTENDVVLKQPSIDELVEDCSLMGLNLGDSNRRRDLEKFLDRARRGNSAVLVESLNVLAGWDETHEEYYVVIRDMYDPRNLMAVLFERIVSGEGEDTEDEIRTVRTTIEKYLGVIEKKERISLEKPKEKLVALSTDMKRTLAVFENDEYSDEDYEKLSEALDKAYFEPISEILEGVLVTIAGN